MRILFVLTLVCFLIGANPLPKDIMEHPPEYFVLEWDEGTRLLPERTDFFIEIDSFGRQEVFALVNDKKAPILYAADIATPVCADGECKLMHIKFYWTLLGEYAGFDRYPTMPLTKHDHDLFEEADYQKLHRLLSDDKSPLARRTIEQLVEKPKMRRVNGVDAISGATISQVKEAVVSGALYSCYTAWHLVHGDIQKQLKAHTQATLDQEMVIHMLSSSNSAYQLFALDQMKPKEYRAYHERLGQIFSSGTPLVRSIIVKRLHSKYRDTPELQRPFWEAFDRIDSSSRSLMTGYLEEAPDYVPLLLSQKLDSMSKNQMKAYLNHLTAHNATSNEIRTNLEKFIQQGNQTYAYLVQEFLEE